MKIRLPERLRHIRGIGWILGGLVLGILLLCLPELSGGNRTRSAEEEDAEAYGARMEHKIAQMTEAFLGCGGAEVLVTVECTAETVYAEDITVTGAESRSEKILLAQGSQPVPLTKITPRIRGIAVVCPGGGDPQVQMQLISLLTAAFGISAAHVYVGGTGGMTAFP